MNATAASFFASQMPIAASCRMLKARTSLTVATLAGSGRGHFARRLSGTGIGTGAGGFAHPDKTAPPISK